MTDLKVVLGFVELALAVKFLANADNVKQWGILKREIFIGLWILIGLSIVLYLVGAIRFSHSTRPKNIQQPALHLSRHFHLQHYTLYQDLPIQAGLNSP